MQVPLIEKLVWQHIFLCPPEGSGSADLMDVSWRDISQNSVQTPPTLPSLLRGAHSGQMPNPFTSSQRENIFPQKHRRVICSGSSLLPLKGGFAHGPSSPFRFTIWWWLKISVGSKWTFSTRWLLKCGKCVHLIMTKKKREYFSSSLTLKGPRWWLILDDNVEFVRLWLDWRCVRMISFLGFMVLFSQRFAHEVSKSSI